MDGFWILSVITPQFTSGGVVLFSGGKLFGGDNGFCWTGSYSTNGQTLKARVRVHNFDPKIKSVFGVDGDYELHVSGQIQDKTITGTAVMANQPQHSVGMQLVRYSSL
jgi:hypothetical protein